jgi:FixJ family two-component response regulator
VIYIIDDDPSILKAFQRLFRSDKLPAVVFSSAEEFLGQVSVREEDCLVLDLEMPGMKGFTLLEELKKRGAQVPVIVVTAFDDSQTRERTNKLGAEAFFRKPVDAQALLDSVHWAIDKKRGKSDPH